MPYTKTVWVDDDGSRVVGTPVTADVMNNIEDYIELLDDLSFGIRYNTIGTVTSADPGSGNFGVNAGVTELYISETDADGLGVGGYMNNWDDSTNPGTLGYLLFRYQGGGRVVLRITGALTDNGTWRTVPIGLVAFSGTLTGLVSIHFYRVGDKGDRGAAGADGETPATVEMDGATLSSAGTGDLSWQYSSVSATGLLVLIVSNDSSPSDDVSGVTVAGRSMIELPGSPFLQTSGSEDGVIYAYWLAYPSVGGTVRVTVSGASTKIGMAIGFRANGELVTVCDVVTDDVAFDTVFQSDDMGGIARRNFLVAALHSGADAVGTITAPSDEQIIGQHDFGATTAHWVAMLEDVYGRENIVLNSSASEEGGLFAVAVSAVQNHGLVSELPTQEIGHGDTCILDAGDGLIQYVYNSSGWVEMSSPWSIDLDVYTTPITQTNWNTFGVNANAINNGYKLSTGAQNAEIGWDIELPAGTWTISLLHTQGANRGIYTVSLDGASVGTIDGYAAGGGTFNVISDLTGVRVTSGGKKRLLLKMATKNGASSAYFGSIQALTLRRTA